MRQALFWLPRPSLVPRRSFCTKYGWETDYDLKDAEISNILLRGTQEKQIQLSDTEEEDASTALKESGVQKISRMQAISQEYQNQDIESKYMGKTDVQVKYYKYGLPIPNLDPLFRGLDEIMEDERLQVMTPHENLCSLLQITSDTPFEEYRQALQTTFNHQEDMYGDLLDESQITQDTLARLGDCAVPMSTLRDKDYMFYVRKYYSINISLPGCIETENPNRFIRDLRPIEDFRHTPVIPVSDAEIRRWQDRMASYHKNIFFFEVKKETIFNYFIFAVILYCGLFLVKVALDKQDQMGIAYQRLQLERIKYN